MLISVIIPVYNSEKFLNRCVDSVLKQSYKELDIILWRDGRHRTLPRRDFSVRALIKP